MEKNIKKDYKYPIWTNVIFAIIFIITGIQSIIGLLVWVIIFIITKPYFTKQALYIKTNPLYPYFMVIFFVLPGYIIWYIYYRIKLNTSC